MEAEQTELQVLVVKLFQGQGQNQGAIPVGGGQTGGGVPSNTPPVQSESLAYSSFLEDNGE